MAHAIGHALGSLYHVPHGVAVAVGLEAALTWNIEGAPSTLGPVATALGVDLDGPRRSGRVLPRAVDGQRSAGRRRHAP